MKVLKLSLLFVMLGVTTPMIAACDQNKGPAEEMGESIDEAVEEVNDEIDDHTTAQ